mgnify:CR=1 FL=1
MSDDKQSHDKKYIPIEINNWEALPNAKNKLLRGIYAYGFEQPSPIQKKAIVPLFDKKDKGLKLQYFHFQDLWAFKTLSKNSIFDLVDIGSNLSFITFASSVSKIKCLDIRPHEIYLKNVDFIIGDINKLPFSDDSVNNLSSLSVIEHIGLGRYGDNIDLFGMEKSVKEFERVLKKNGNLIVSFPVGKKNIIEFNAHRICNLEYIDQLFKNFILKNETLIYRSRYNSREEFKKSGEPDCVACFHFIKK